jgi:hydroxyacylglutathione hydrolase
MVEQLFCNIKNKSTIYRYVSELFGVCTYFIIDSQQIIIIDPGKLDRVIFSWLESFPEKRKVLYFTHEHFDHHFSANSVLQLQNAFLFIPSESFSEAIKDTRSNLSYFYSNPISTHSNLISSDSHFDVIKTPGHSKESYCYIYDDLLFGGDTVIDRKHLVLKLPGGNKNEFDFSYKKLKDIIKTNLLVLPGHGDFFYFNSWVI